MPPPGEPPAMEIVLGQFCGTWAETSVTPKLSEKSIAKQTTLEFNVLIIVNPLVVSLSYKNYPIFASFCKP
jgi:hypothetical protein